MKSQPSPEERRAYANGYRAGRGRRVREQDPALDLFGCLVDGLTLRGMTIDEILDAQIAGAMARAETRPEA